MKGRSWLVALAVAAIALLTLTPGERSPSVGSALCVICGTRGLADALLNVLLFAPLGAALFERRIRLGHALLAGFLLSATIEVLQVFVVAGRDAAFGDIVFNTLGTCCGYGVIRSSTLWLFPTARLSRLLSISATAAAILVLVVGAILLRPAFPHAYFYGQWTPRFDNMEHYEGRVLSARAGDVAVGSEILHETEIVRRSLLNGGTLSVRFIVGRPPVEAAPIFNFYDALQREVIMLAAKENDLIIRYRSIAGTVRLDQPVLVARDAFRDARAGDTLSMQVRRVPRGICVTVGAASDCPLGFTIGNLWMLLVATTSRAAGLVDGIFLIMLFVPAGFWITRVSTAWVTYALAAVAAVALPAVTGLQPTPLAQFFAVALGMAMGVLARAGLHSIRTRWTPTKVCGSSSNNETTESIQRTIRV